MTTLKAEAETPQTAETRRGRYARAAALLRQWLCEADAEGEGSYDWDAIDRELNDAAMRCREVETRRREST
ncbi:MAG: hypothetical protein KF861_20080 [Planctomycetaceae bacterium]|nr:hypothetical protein [Planctomycetaceae bacterium]